LLPKACRIGYNLWVSSNETLTGLRRRIQREEIQRALEHDHLLRVHLEPAGGWVKRIRTALGMTAKQLGRRVGVSQNAISEAERAEVEGRISLKTLKKIADGLDSDLVYALVPRAPLDQIVHNNSNRAAHRIVGEISQGMALEGQSTDDSARAAQVDALRERLIAEGSSQIWD
jgi:predicted DNA-binding mobile mystery protein A